MKQSNYTISWRLVCLFILFSSFCNGQDYLANVKFYGIEEGLSNRDIYAVHQDREGFIWIGTKYGLNRFDGHSFQVLTKEKDGLASDLVHHILEDDGGKLWIFEVNNWFHASFPKHISIIDQSTNTILPIKTYFNEELPFLIDELSHFMANEQGELFFSTRGGKLYVYDSANGFQQIPLNTSQEFIPLFCSPSNSIWGTLMRDPKHVGELVEINREGHLLNRYSMPVGGGWVSILGLDKDQKLWLTTRVDQVGDVLLYLEKEEDRIHIYEDKEQLLPSQASLDWSSRVVLRPQDQSIWWKHEPGFSVFLPGEKQLFDFGSQTPEIGNANIKAIYFDRKGSAWVGTAFGLYRIELNPNPFTHFLSMDYKEYEVSKAFSCRGIWGTSDHLYLNTYKGRYQIDRSSGEKTRLPFIPYTSPDDVQTLLGYFPLALFQDRQDNLWFSDYSLIQRSAKGDGEKYFITKNDFIKPPNIWSIYQDENENIWGGTEKGLAFLDRKTSEIRLLAPEPKFKELSQSFVHAFVKSKAGPVWLATTSGLYRWSPEQGILQRYWTKGGEGYIIPHNNILHVHEENSRQVWLATGGGGLILLAFNEDWEIETFQQFTVAEGLSNNNIYAVYEDRKEQLWMSSDFGIIQFDKNTHEAKAYLPKDGVTHHEFNRIAHHQGKDGKLYFGSLNGVTAFYPEEVEVLSVEETYDAPLKITHYQQYDRALDTIIDGTFDLLKKGKIALTPNDRFHTLSFALLEYTNARQNRYRYKLEGWNEEWTHIHENSIRLNSLPYGNYQLLIQGQAADGRFSSQRLRIPIEVIRPYYAQLWFKLLVLGSTLLLVFTLYKWRIRSLRQRQVLLEKVVKERTQTIEEQAEELRQMDQMKSRFFTNVSHELRTPLTLILGPLGTVLKSGDLQKKHNQLLKIVRQNGQELLDLVNEILDLTKLDAGKLDLNEAPTPLYSLLYRIISSFESLAEYQNISFQFEYQAHRDLQLELDVDKFQKIVNNLLSNAFKFTPEDGRVEVLLVDLGSHIQLKVTDTGRGIHSDDLPFVFDRYYQSKQPSAKTEGGTGIGLALCKEYSKLFQGQLTIDSTLGEGSVFIFEFPKKEIIKSMPSEAALDLVKERERLSEKSKWSTPVKRFDAATLLLVEDNHSLQEYIQLVLSEEYEVLTAENGEVALKLLEGEKLPDLIISDIMMPIMDGFQLLEKLKSSTAWRSIPVVMLTARAGIRDKLKALRIGVDDYLTKPFEEEELLARVANLMKNQKEKRAWLQTLKQPEVETLEKKNQSLSLSEEDVEWLKKMETLVEQEQGDSTFNVERLTELLFLSRRQLQRRIKQLTGLSPNQYIQEARLQTARQALETRSQTSVKAIAYTVGMRDVKYFSQQFKKRFGKLPSSYL